MRKKSNKYAQPNLFFRIVLVIVYATYTSLSLAQTITTVNQAPRDGDIVVRYQANISNPGIRGEEVIWDYGSNDIIINCL